VDLDKDAEFLGREALRRVRAEGVKRRLVGVEIEGAPIEFNMTRWPVRKGSENIGQVTSAIYSPRLQKNIGYAMVPVAHAALGTSSKWKHARWRRRAQWFVPDAICGSSKNHSEVVRLHG
jgi:glycine cleavage system aminomethyltransferase T